ncbi:hypothetical protein Thiowin_04155 [Thiorhodovibrio winogradskyi]|uniref:Uncharacterized protein n=1 Tax=Thiorhodovibrio winogradskyi TaxID=77007 RepID=A0ABZ0SGZ5_9GAMM|nr:hypothetical protein [Thiorhodovibrio winogradskyi]
MPWARIPAGSTAAWRCSRNWVNRCRRLCAAGYCRVGPPVASWRHWRALAPTDAETLLASLQREPLSTRELNAWYQHYLQANRTVRARLLAQPRLFIQAKESANLPKSTDPEAQFHARLAQIRRELQALMRSLPV